jgi:hypothetical protein
LIGGVGSRDTAHRTPEWLVRFKQHTGIESISPEELMCESLGFGWVDGVLRRLGDDRHALRITSRKPTSSQFNIYRSRWKVLEAAGLFDAAARRAAGGEP